MHLALHSFLNIHLLYSEFAHLVHDDCTLILDVYLLSLNLLFQFGVVLVQVFDLAMEGFLTELGFG